MAVGNGICHIEIPSRDLDQSMAFFEKIFSWRVEKMGDAYALFAILGEDGKPVLGGGFDPNREPQSSTRGVVFYVECPDIGAKLSEIEDAGGRTIQEKTEISPEHGYFAHFEDPSGNRLGLWSRT